MAETGTLSSSGKKVLPTIGSRAVRLVFGALLPFCAAVYFLERAIECPTVGHVIDKHRGGAVDLDSAIKSQGESLDVGNEFSPRATSARKWECRTLLWIAIAFFWIAFSASRLGQRPTLDTEEATPALSNPPKPQVSSPKERK